MEFCAALRAHVRKEETVLFELAQKHVPVVRLREVGESRTREGNTDPVGVTGNSRLLACTSSAYEPTSG